MKKITVLAAVLVLCAAHASAYENSYAGYSVKDGQPYYKLEAKKVYAYTNISSKKVYQNEENLKNTGNNLKWLYDNMKKQNIDKIDEILLGTCDADNNLTLYKKINNLNNYHDMFE